MNKSDPAITNIIPSNFCVRIFLFVASPPTFGKKLVINKPKAKTKIGCTVLTICTKKIGASKDAKDKAQSPQIVSISFTPLKTINFSP